MSGRRAKAIRRAAEQICASRGMRDAGGYQPQEIRNRAGKVVRRYPETRLMPGARGLARRMRREYARSNRRMPDVLLPS